MIKVVVAKPGLDSHYRGAMVVSRYLIERGMEVVYVGNQLPAQIVATVIEEDADVLGLSSLSGNHNVMVPRILEELHRQGMDHVVVVLGGIVPDEDALALETAGVDRIFGPGSDLVEIGDFIAARAASRREAELTSVS
jgi:methylmalonyl-CoA mutase C-terminal domain/subunit